MRTVKDVFIHLNKLADVKLAENWDNVGLLLGNNNNEVNKVLVCLDVTTDVIEEAIANNVNLIVSHHPLIFKPLKSLDFTSDFKSRIIRDLIKNDISVISFHTNLDSATLGLNDYLAKLLKLEDIQVLFEHNLDKTAGLGRIGKLSSPLKYSDFITYLKDKFSLENVAAVIGDKKEISTVALLGGSGADFIYTLPEVDVYLTGDVGYHVALDAIEMKKNIIDIGHYTESLVKDLLLDYISELNVEVIKSTVEKSPFTKATPTMEDYIEVIYSLVKNKGYARSADIAEKLEVYPSTVTKMLKKLDVEGYIVYEKYRGIALTEQGEKMGEYALTRHELLEDFLRLIGVDEDKIYEEVEGIEHHFGKSSLEKIKDLMKYLKENNYKA